MINYAVVIQARMNSTRLPAKVSKLLLGEEMLYHQILRLKKGGIDHVFVATSSSKEDERIVEIAKRANVEVFCGSLNDVLSRYCDAASHWDIKNVIRVGGDDPLVDPQGILALIRAHENNPCNLVYSSHSKGWIYGTAAELIETEALIHCRSLAKSSEDKEHVVSYIRKSPAFSKSKVYPVLKEQRSDIYLSVDYEEDIHLIEQILTYFDNDGRVHTFLQQELIELYDSGKVVISNRDLHSGFEE